MPPEPEPGLLPELLPFPDERPDDLVDFSPAAAVAGRPHTSVKAAVEVPATMARRRRKSRRDRDSVMADCACVRMR